MRRAALLLALAACHPERQEAQKVLAAIDRLEDADPGAREAELARLEAMTAPPPAEAARAACAAKHRALMSTQKAVQAAKEAPLGARAELLTEAQNQAALTRAKIAECAEAKEKLRHWLADS